jgi:hypothetical protein
MTYGFGANLLEGTPILCKNCGGPMRLQSNFGALCGYCGARDQLPFDEGARYLELKNRLSFARSRALQLQGIDAALARVFEDKGAFWRVAGLYLGMALAMLGSSTAMLWSNDAISANVPEAYRRSMWVHQLFGPGMLVGAAFSLGLGLWVGRRHFRRRVRPMLMAGPLRAGHRAFGCRVCGAELRPVAEASATCSYCGSMNLLPVSEHDASVAALNAQAQVMQRAAHGAQARMISVSALMRRAVIAGVVLNLLFWSLVPQLLDRYVFVVR